MRGSFLPELFLFTGDVTASGTILLASLAVNLIANRETKHEETAYDKH